jgi:hypothetical protein
MQFGPVAGGFWLAIGAGKKSKSYNVRPIDSDFGKAFEVQSRTDGEVYHVLLAGPETTCTCPGYCYTSGCKHVSALLRLEGGAA